MVGPAISRAPYQQLQACFSNNLTTFAVSLMNENGFTLSEDDDILVGPPEGSDFFVQGMGGVLVCQVENPPKQSRLEEVV